MNHLSLFSGIGGFDLAAEWMGWENIGQVEKDHFCLQVLTKNFPNVPKYTDIRDFPTPDFTSRPDLITGGFPCQPFSQAGKRKGTNDDRHLWPEMLRVISTLKPTWVVAENVRGILTIEQGLVFEQVCLDLEDLGYEVQPLIIPAVAVNAPHRRDRVWFIAYSHENANRRRGEQIREAEGVQGISGETLYSRMFSGTNKDVTDSGFEHGCEGNDERMETSEVKRTACTTNIERPNQDDSDAINKRLERSGNKTKGYRGQSSREWSNQRRDWGKNWIEVATEFCRVDDGLSVELDGFKLSKSKHRADQLKGYGNAIVPQVAYEIFKSIINTK